VFEQLASRNVNQYCAIRCRVATLVRTGLLAAHHAIKSLTVVRKRSEAIKSG
jgi:hypothetical protein